MHRDIKLENILIRKGTIVKLADLGSASFLDKKEKLTEYISTRWYRAPEIIVNPSLYD